jgi:hypothetical protein
LHFFSPFFLGHAVITQGQAEDYYFYESPNGELVISNKQPTPGSKIIKQHRFPEATNSEAPQSQRNNPQPNMQKEDSPKPSKYK